MASGAEFTIGEMKSTITVGFALCGGRAYSLLCDFYRTVLREVVDITKEEVYNIMERFLSRRDAPLTVDTRFDGTRENSTLRGKIDGISTENLTPSALTRGVLYGMVEELYSMYLTMKNERTFAVASGNAIRKNPTLLAIAGERFGMSVAIPRHLEEGAYGAALFGALCAKIFPTMYEAQKRIHFN